MQGFAFSGPRGGEPRLRCRRDPAAMAGLADPRFGIDRAAYIAPASVTGSIG